MAVSVFQMVAVVVQIVVVMAIVVQLGGHGGAIAMVVK